MVRGAAGGGSVAGHGQPPQAGLCSLAMYSLVPLDECLSRALEGRAPLPVVPLPTRAAVGHVLAEALVLPADIPAQAQALRAGLAVAALDTVGASAGAPVPLGDVARVLPGQPLPPGADAVLPEDGVEGCAALVEAIRPVDPGEGTRRAGHDGRAGALLAQPGAVVTHRLALVAALAGMAELPVRRAPVVRVALPDPALVGFATGWLAGLGAVIGTDAPDLTLAPTAAHTPRLALAPADTAWLAGDGAGLVLEVPARFDGMVTALLALALPVLAALTGASPRPRSLPLARKASSTVGLSELVLLAEADGTWLPHPPGTLTASALAAASAFAILPPDSEGLPAGAPLAGVPLDHPLV